MTLAKVATMKAQERKINSASSSVCGWLSSFPCKSLSEGILSVLALSLHIAVAKYLSRAMSGKGVCLDSRFEGTVHHVPSGA